MKRLISTSPEITVRFGYEYAKTLKNTDILGLIGELGSGKTCLVRGIAKYFRITDDIISPTFLILNQYKGINPLNHTNIIINHFDFYRLKSYEELHSIGFDEYISDMNAINIIEWPSLLLNEKFKMKQWKKIILKHGKESNIRIIRY
ncbi:MAG: tRNA (adenosine(37)-N6)-threonylcarbamoyltransferase complex ATPase subunit type 1 TsaE [Ignavibacteria bacterium]|nr:tRNA (adenosine(37)-N6)-threonylcarbamoyltransferase complex ATPase subunit type 1 TsaE [Ignavibacteria bacterium]